MTEVAKTTSERRLSQRLYRGLGLSASGLVLGASSAALYFDNSEIQTEVAATAVEISPNYTNTFVTFQNGLLPDVRIPSDMPIGLDIEVGNTNIPSGGMASDNGKRLEAAYAALAAQPDGEIDKVSEQIKHRAYESLGIGVIAGTMPLAIFMALGAPRRKELMENGRCIPVMGAVALTISIAGTVASYESTAKPEETWIPITQLTGGIAIPELASIEVKDSAVTGIGTNLLSGIIDKYEQSKIFYESLEQSLSESEAEFHTPEDNQVVALLVSDRHDNIGMDPVLRATGDAAGASILIDAGDDTSAGQKWETFSLRSLMNNFKDYKVVAVGGNHDNGGYVVDYLEERGATTPNGEVQSLEAITMVLANDPRRSDYTPERAEGSISFADTETQITELACSSKERVSLIVVHDANMASEVLDSGCADLVVGGHTHEYSGPESILGDNAINGYTLTNGTSGGATFSISLGRKLQKEASATLITFEDGRPVGVQPVEYQTDGTHIIGSYRQLGLSDLDTTTLGQMSPDNEVNEESTAQPSQPPVKK